MQRALARGNRTLRIAVGVAGVTIAIAGLTACGSDSSDGNAGKTSSDDTSASNDAAPSVANVEITAAEGCVPDTTTLAAGGVTIKVKNVDATAVSEIELLSDERIVGEKENLPPGLDGEFAATVTAGDYTLYCPGATPEKTAITVTGEAAQVSDDTAALLKQATEGYAAYVSTQAGYLVAAVADLQTAIKSGDLAKAQEAYKKARPFYEKIEPVAESFVSGKQNLDADIDARDGDVVPAKNWRGFHVIEKGLFQDKSLDGLDKVAARLLVDVKKLQSLTDGLTYQATELANGAQELLDEMATGKIIGEEERYSHIDLLDFANNDEGAQQAFAQLKPVLEKIDPTLASTISDRFAALDTLLNSYRTGDDPSGFVLFTDLTKADKLKLAAAVKAVQEPMSKVASKVANVN
ncbi:MAG: EfeM/EfeO family lipoprotein [Nocardioidaceae bacterium]